MTDPKNSPEKGGLFQELELGYVFRKVPGAIEVCVFVAVEVVWGVLFLDNVVAGVIACAIMAAAMWCAAIRYIFLRRPPMPPLYDRIANSIQRRIRPFRIWLLGGEEAEKAVHIFMDKWFNWIVACAYALPALLFTYMLVLALAYLIHPQAPE